MKILHFFGYDGTTYISSVSMWFQYMQYKGRYGRNIWPAYAGVFLTNTMGNHLEDFVPIPSLNGTM